MRHSEKTITSQGLNLDEYQQICDKIGREPNEVELGIFAVMWSEHCSYKSSRKWLKGFPTTGPQVIQGPGENAGVVDIGDGYAAAFKMESHNHPSFIEPYQGAATGVGGILRDVFAMGARPIAILNSLRFGEASHSKTPHLVSGVVSGISGYGNCMGVPTVGGEVYFDACYNGNILVNAMAIGLVKTDEIFRGYASGIGNPLIYVGSKTGRDGIHGATMASDEFSAENEEKRPTVQVGDPFTEKLLLEACLELMHMPGVIVGVQDMGAAGLTSSSFEMASRAGTGLFVELDKVPQRETGMTPYELLLSESQERMLMVIEKGREPDAYAVFEKWGLDVAVIGTVVPGNRMQMTWHGETVVDLPISPVTDEAPVYNRPIARPDYLDRVNTLNTTQPLPPLTMSLKDAFLRVLASPNIVSRRPIYEQYDHMVMTNTVVCPGSDAAVVRIKGTSRAIAATTNCNSRYCYLDPHLGSKIAVAECARNLSASGATPLALTDCLNFGNPERPEIMWQFKESVEGISAACRELEVPVVSGNVSLYNETEGTAIYPTPGIGMVGVIENVSRHVTQHFKATGDVIYLLGETKNELGGSEYLAHVHHLVLGPIPALDTTRELATHTACRTMIQEELLQSAHDLSEGGLAIALAESAFHPKQRFGFDIALTETSGNHLSPEAALFSETQSRFIVSCKPAHAEKLEAIAKKSGVPCSKLGTVTLNTMRITNGETELFTCPSEDAFAAWTTWPV